MLLLLVGLSIYSGGVSNAPLLLIFVLAAMVAVVSLRGMKFSERVAIFSQGAGSKDLLLMVWIFRPHIMRGYPILDTFHR